ncbi:MAG: ArnT family glycosyltransferase [Anaerolineales bacterium]
MNQSVNYTTIGRHRVLLLSAWILILFYVLGMWVFSPSEDTEALSQLTQPAIGLLLGVFLTPLILLLIYSKSQGRSTLLRFQAHFQSAAVFSLLLIGLGLGEIYYIFADIGTFSAASFIMLILLMALLLHLFLGRSSLNTVAIVVSLIWFVSIVLARQSLSQLLAVGSFDSPSWRYKAIILGLSAILAALVLLPCGLLSRRLTATAKASARKYSRHAGWLFVVAVVASFTIMILVQVTDFESLQLVVLGRISIVLVAGTAIWSSVQSKSFFGKGTSHGFEDLPVWAYGGSLFAVALGFALVSSRMTITGINPDGLSYFTIARQYAEGNPVVRGYWSPLLSWLMAPAIALKADPVRVHIVLTQLSTLVWIYMTVLTARRLGLSRYARVGLAILVSMISITYAFIVITPDLLGAATFSVGFYLIANPRIADRPLRNGVIFGSVIALSYYAKYYNLTFFIALLPLLILLLVARGENRSNSLKVVLISVSTAALLLLPWMIGMWSRYGEVTITTSAAISRAVVGPEFQRHECWEFRLCDTPIDVLFPWEDPQAQYYSEIGWSPFDSLPLLGHQIRLIWSNALRWLGPTPIGPHPTPLLLLVLLVLLPLIYWNSKSMRHSYLLILAAFGLYAGGYLLTFGEDFRYYFPIIPIVWLAGFAAIMSGFHSALPLAVPMWVYRLIMAIALVFPILAFSWLSRIRFRTQLTADTCLEEAAPRIAEHLEPPIAGTDSSINYLAYYTGMRTLGVIPTSISLSELDTQLRDFEIRTLVAPADSELVENLAAQYGYLSTYRQVICDGTYEVLRIP